MSESGLRSTIGNRVYAKSVSGVRIPISPPVDTMPVGMLTRFGAIATRIIIEPFVERGARKSVFFYQACYAIERMNKYLEGWQSG